MPGDAASPEHKPPPAWSSAPLLGALLGLAGGAHFLITDTYARIVPRFLPAPRALVLASGAAELGCAAMLIMPRTRRAGAWCAFALLFAVWPANVQMALDGGIPGSAGLLGSPVTAWARVPLQVPLLYWAYRLARSSRPASVHDSA